MPLSITGAKIATLITALFLAGLATGALAAVEKTEAADKTAIESTPVANIYYFGRIDQIKTKELFATIDSINLTYSHVKKINLYINSGGGDMDSGFAAYWAIRSSTIPVTTINLSVVGSAATMLFCASENRLSIKGARFILHPAALVVDNKTGSYQPNNLVQMQQNLVGFNKMFADIYKTCTTFKPQEIDDILSSEDSRKFILEEEAQSRGLIKGTTDKISPASITYYITDAS